MDVQYAASESYLDEADMLALDFRTTEGITSADD